MHTFSPAKMWIAGLGALQKPLLHLHTQFNRDLPWAEIDMDFMNLNQSAHGDREFGFMETRMGLARKTVVGHWTDPRRARADRRLGARRVRLARGAAAAGSPASATTCAQVAVTEGDKVEAQIRLGVSVNGYGVGDLVEAVDAVAGRRGRRARRRVRRRATTSRPSSRGRRTRRESLRDAARIEAGLRELPRRGRLPGVHRHVRGPRTG